MERVLAAVVGGLLALVSWLLLVPWDLSEVDADGRMSDHGADDVWGMIALVAGIVVAAAVGLVVNQRTRWSSVWIALGGLIAWAVLFTWRVGTSDTAGANMFMVPLLVAVLPVTIAVPLVLHRIADRLTR